MSLKYSTREVRDVTILDISGRITLGEGARTLRDAVREQLGKGKKNLLLNLADVSYMDSSGNGEIVSAFTTAVNFGGKLKLLSLTKRLHDILQITKLYTVYEVFDDEADAVRSFSTSAPRLRARCPLCAQWSTPSTRDADGRLSQQCVFCGADYTAEAPEGPAQRLRVIAIKLRTYWEGSVEVYCGFPFELAIHGRLTMFSAGFIQRIWKALPEPRRVLIDLRELTEVEERGREALLGLLNAQNTRVAVSTEGFKGKIEEMLPGLTGLHAERSAALAGLGDVSGTPQIFVEAGMI